MTVAAENLGKRYNRDWIFRNFNYTFSPGVYAVTGPNGSGKSTLLHVLWGQLPWSAGSVQYQNDHQPVAVEDVFKYLVVSAPYMDLIEEFTLQEVLNFHFSFKRSRHGKKVEELLELMEMTSVRNKPIAHFSSGMKQRVRLGLAFFSDVKMLFLDEPTTNLDRQSVEWYWRNFRQLSEDLLIIIGSNLENEYPDHAKKIYLPDFK
jgi:ABC-type multidrug transport system ATPase subunit